jgi:hypothetical protein
MTQVELMSANGAISGMWLTLTGSDDFDQDLINMYDAGTVGSVIDQ